MTARRYRKKPVVIEAMVFDGSRASAEAICRWANEYDEPLDEPTVAFTFTGTDDVSDVTIATLEGFMTVSEDDYVIKGVQGEFYPCKPDIFAATHEEVVDVTP